MPCTQDLSRAPAWAAHDAALTHTRTLQDSGGGFWLMLNSDKPKQ